MSTSFILSMWVMSDQLESKHKQAKPVELIFLLVNTHFTKRKVLSNEEGVFLDPEYSPEKTV